MNQNSSLRIGDLLRRPVFQRAKWVAGRDGGDRAVKWVHILEITKIAPFVSKDDLILSTGLWMKQAKSERLGYLEQLIRQEAAGLCVELGTSVQAIPEDVIEEAERHHFPLIVFEQPVRFVEITQDIHGLLINRQHRLLQYVEQSSRRFQQLTLQTTDVYAVMRLLHEFTGKQTAYFSLVESNRFYPRVSAETAASLGAAFRGSAEGTEGGGEPFIAASGQDGGLLLHPVICFNQTLAYLGVLSMDAEEQAETLPLILDIAAKSVATMLMRTMFMEEKKLLDQSQLIHDLIGRRIEEEEQALTRMGLRKPGKSPYLFGGGIVEIGYGSEDVLQEQMEADYQDIVVSLRALLRKHGLQSLLSLKENKVYLLLAKERIIEGSAAAMKQALRRIIEELRAPAERGQKRMSLLAGFGKLRGSLISAHKSFKEAEQTLEAARSAAEMRDNLFYDGLGVYQLLLAVPDPSLLDSFVSDQLDILRANDPDGQHQLIRTLDVFFACMGSRQETANRLFIHRQTLYKRLDKLAELLGSDFAEPHRRHSLEMAIVACKLRERGN